MLKELALKDTDLISKLNKAIEEKNHLKGKVEDYSQQLSILEAEKKKSLNEQTELQAQLTDISLLGIEISMLKNQVEENQRERELLIKREKELLVIADGKEREFSEKILSKEKEFSQKFQEREVELLKKLEELKADYSANIQTPPAKEPEKKSQKIPVQPLLVRIWKKNKEKILVSKKFFFFQFKNFFQKILAEYRHAPRKFARILDGPINFRAAAQIKTVKKKKKFFYGY